MPFKDVSDLRKMQALWNRIKKQNEREKILELLKPRCVKCGFADKRALAIDHVNGEGNAHRRKHGGSYLTQIRKDLENGSADYQILCYNCNQIKRVENEETTPRKY